MSFNIFTREMWGATDETKQGKPLEHPVRYIFTMNVNRQPCDSLRECSMEMLLTQEFHMTTQNQPDIRHNFIVTSTGAIFEGRGWYTQPLLPNRFQTINSESILIGYLGTGLTVETMPKRMSIAGRLLVDYGIKNGFVSKFFLYNDQMSFQTKHHELRKAHKKEQDENIRRSMFG